MEAQQQEAFKQLAIQEDLLSFKQELLKELSKMREDAARTEATLVKEISGKYN